MRYLLSECLSSAAEYLDSSRQDNESIDVEASPSSRPGVALFERAGVEDLDVAKEGALGFGAGAVCQERKTPTWQLSILPAAPQDWRLTPTLFLPCLGKPVSSMASAASSSPKPAMTSPSCSSRKASACHAPRPSRCWKRYGVSKPATSASCHCFFVPLRSRDCAGRPLRSRAPPGWRSGAPIAWSFPPAPREAAFLSSRTDPLSRSMLNHGTIIDTTVIVTDVTRR